MYTQLQNQRLLESLQVEMGEFGQYLADPQCEDIWLNADGVVWVKRLGESAREVGQMDAGTAITVITSIASIHDVHVNHEHPYLETTLPLNDSRIEALIPPCVEQPIFAIRLKAQQIFSLQDYVNHSIATEVQVNLIRKAIRERKNILIAGATGSGKTTLGNACLSELYAVAAAERIVLIEDTPELQCAVKNHVALRTTTTITMLDLLRMTLRLAPDRIIVGEVRGKEAHALLKAWNTGHPGGIATLHADSAVRALDRLEDLVREELPGYSPQRMISEAVDLVVSICKDPTALSGRVVRELMFVNGYDPANGKYQVEYA
jgi:type IV secretion system protein TrbB